MVSLSHCRKIQTIELHMLPLSVNQLFANAGRHRIRTRKYDAWLVEAMMRFGMDLKPVDTYPVAITTIIYGGKGFRINRDIANCEKPIGDALVKAGIIKDDDVRHIWKNTQIYIAPTSKEDVAKCIVLIEEGKPEFDGLSVAA